MAPSKRSPRVRRSRPPIERPWFVTIGSAVFILCVLFLAAGENWRLDAEIGGIKRTPVWLLLASLPFWTAGLVLGIAQLLRRRSAAKRGTHD